MSLPVPVPDRRCGRLAALAGGALTEAAPCFKGGAGYLDLPTADARSGLRFLPPVT